MANRHSTSHPKKIIISQHERFYRINQFGLPLCGSWLQEAGFYPGLSVKLRIMPGCIVVTAQDLHNLWQTLERSSVEPFNPTKAAIWLSEYPGGLIIE